MLFESLELENATAAASWETYMEVQRVMYKTSNSRKHRIRTHQIGKEE